MKAGDVSVCTIGNIGTLTNRSLPRRADRGDVGQRRDTSRGPARPRSMPEPIVAVATPPGCPAVSVFRPQHQAIIAITDTSVLQRELHQAPCLAVAINGPTAKNR